RASSSSTTATWPTPSCSPSSWTNLRAFASFEGLPCKHTCRNGWAYRVGRPMGRFRILKEIRTLDPVKDHQRIVFLSTCYEFPFDTTRSLEFALYRTYCVPSISALLDRTGEFAARPQKRYDDTDLIVSELMEWGYDSDRGKRALRRMNQLHGMFNIANEDY